MHSTSRTAIGAAIAAVLASIAVPPPAAASPEAGTASSSGITGSAASAGRSVQSTTVTLVTGDQVLVTGAAGGGTSVRMLPGADGTVPGYLTRQRDGHTYVIPESAVPALAAGTVDEQLFDVTGLVEQGYDDAHTKQLPLIVQYGDGQLAVAREAAPAGTDLTRTLPVIDSLALTVDKGHAAQAWTALVRRTARTAAQPVRIWLDAKAKAMLADSVSQIKAPEAWQAGYDGTGSTVAVLDTGIDADHPDFAGQIAATKDFTGDGMNDVVGHGTHVASTVAGTGAASGGKEKGVAPGAKLLIGKVLDNTGSGTDSEIIAGMQWAVDQHADVVSMSLGTSAPSDCSDPMSQAAAELAKNTHSLFVIAAGNLGPRGSTVSSPGCVPGVLTVGAVDSADATAWFSSRGPVTGSHTLKPEIAAPGVDILAAKAGGRGDDAYQTMSGTSMATPHVAGAAAVLHQAHPDWTAQQLKAGLVSAADAGVPGDVQETGAGRLDVLAATGEDVLGSASVDAGSYDWPHTEGDRNVRHIPYTNTTGHDITLTAAVEDLTGQDGKPVKAKVAELDEDTVTVPAHGTAELPLAVDPGVTLDEDSYGGITGRVVARSSDGQTVSTPFSLWLAPETVTLKVNLIDRNGNPATGSSLVDLIDLEGVAVQRSYTQGSSATFTIRAGTYSIDALALTQDGGGTTQSAAYLGEPESDLHKDTTVTLDARRAHPITVDTGKPLETRGSNLEYTRTWNRVGQDWTYSAAYSGGPMVQQTYAWTDGKAHDGTFTFDSSYRMGAPVLTMHAGGLDLQPVVNNAVNAAPARLDGSGSTALVDAGTGTADELTAAGVQGQIALVRAETPADATTAAAAAKAAGAVALVAYRTAPGRWTPAATDKLPLAAVTSETAGRLHTLLGRGGVTLHWTGVANSPYAYNLVFEDTGKVGADQTHRLGSHDLAGVDATYYGLGGSNLMLDYVDAYTPGNPAGLPVGPALDRLPTPLKRTEYYLAGDVQWNHGVMASFPWGSAMEDQPRTYTAGQHRSEQWFRGVLRPVAPTDDAGAPILTAERQGDLIGYQGAFWGDAAAHWTSGGSFGDIGNLTLRRDGETVDTSATPFGVFEVPDSDAAYELEMHTFNILTPNFNWRLSKSVDTVWKFRSHRDDSQASQGIPILYPGYDVPVDTANTVAAAAGQRIGLTVSGHAGYSPGAITVAALSYSYDDGATWTEAPVQHTASGWSATVDHTGHSGAAVTLKADITDANGNAVTQTVQRAYLVR
ncbi:S8 family peptidase [Peterkaempfera sp. SMS 1(5)a]|uniref:S8 family peptidase n=1 Tax=Peterkaempfera podocarpi TaxID=3232308 RepID=UPI00366A5BF2